MLEAENAELRHQAADLALAIHEFCYPKTLFDGGELGPSRWRRERPN